MSMSLKVKFPKEKYSEWPWIEPDIGALWANIDEE